jgi:hypothetical protein
MERESLFGAQPPSYRQASSALRDPQYGRVDDAQMLSPLGNNRT